MKLIWSGKAKNDLLQIMEYLTLTNDDYLLNSTIKRIVTTTEKLISFPNLGKIGRMPETKELVMPDMPFIIVYRMAENIEILRVVHTSRYWNKE